MIGKANRIKKIKDKNSQKLSIIMFDKVNRIGKMKDNTNKCY